MNRGTMTHEALTMLDEIINAMHGELRECLELEADEETITVDHIRRVIDMLPASSLKYVAVDTYARLMRSDPAYAEDC